MWFWIGVAVVAVGVWLMLPWRSRGGGEPRPFCQTRDEVRGTDKYGSLTRPQDEHPRDT